MADVSSRAVDPAKDPKLAPSTLSSYTATLINSSSVTLTLTQAESNEQWTQPPPNTIPPGGQGIFSSPGDFSNPAAGNVQYTDGNGGTIAISWDIPSVGPNSIRWTATGDLTMSQSGSTSGWNLTNFYTVNGG